MPEPLFVELFKMVGLEVVLLQHKPLDVIVAPPSVIMFPPPIADVCVIEDILLVDKPIGKLAAIVEKTITFPYVVPMLFVEMMKLFKLNGKR